MALLWMEATTTVRLGPIVKCEEIAAFFHFDNALPRGASSSARPSYGGFTPTLNITA